MELLSVSLQRGGRYSPLAIAAVISAWTGARRGEVAALSENAIDREHMTITFSRALLYQGGEVYLEDTKNNVVHTSPLGDDLLQAIDDYIAYKKSKGIVPRGKFADLDFLLLNEKTGEPIHPDSITSWIKDFGAKELGIKDLNSYVFRHTVATRLHAAGLPLRAVADQIGDRLISTVDRHYINRLPEFHEQVRGALEDIYTYDGVPTVVKIIDSCIVRTDSGAHFDVAKLQAAIDNPDNWMDTDHLQIVLDHHEEYIEACGDDAGWIFIRADDYAVEHFGKIEND